MKVNESTFWRYIKRSFDKLGVLYDRIEPVSKPGIPDVNALFKGNEVWIELKSEGGLTTGIKKWQTKWAQDRTAGGSTCYLFVKRKTAKLDQLELFIMRGGDWKLLDIRPKVGSSYPIIELIDKIFERRN